MMLTGHIVRILIMTIITEMCLCLMGAGFDINGWMLVGGFVVMIGTIPIVGAMIALSGVEQLMGSRGSFAIATVGLLPTVAAIFIAGSFAMTGYGFALMASGWLWGLGWLLTSHILPKQPLSGDLKQD